MPLFNKIGQNTAKTTNYGMTEQLNESKPISGLQANVTKSTY